MKDLNILSVRVYQSVQLNGKQNTFFSTLHTPAGPGVSIELIDNIGVLIKSTKDEVIVPFTNVSGIYLDTSIKKEEREAFQADISKPAKAQKTGKIKKDPVGAKRIPKGA